VAARPGFFALREEGKGGKTLLTRQQASQLDRRSPGKDPLGAVRIRAIFEWVAEEARARKPAPSARAGRPGQTKQLREEATQVPNYLSSPKGSERGPQSRCCPAQGDTTAGRRRRQASGPATGDSCSSTREGPDARALAPTDGAVGRP